MKRFDDWEVRLSKYFTEESDQDFDWGSHDCALFACNAVLAITGVDLAESVRGKYYTAVGAAKLMKELSGGGLPELAADIAKAHELEEVAPLMAQRGDIVLIQNQGHPALGIVSLDGWWILGAAEPHGVNRIPLNQGLRAWRTS